MPLRNSTLTALQNARINQTILLAGKDEADMIVARRRAAEIPLSERERLTVEKMNRAVAGGQQIIAELERLLEQPAELRPDVKADLRQRLMKAADRHLRGVPDIGRQHLVDKIAAEVGI